jgi:hypothetical protein
VEAFEHLVKVMLETDGYVVTTNVKFPVDKHTKNGQIQKHGYEVDVVGARHGSLVLGSVKSFLGSHGVNVRGFKDISGHDYHRDFGLYKLFNDSRLREDIFQKANEKYGYPVNQIELVLYVG